LTYAETGDIKLSLFEKQLSRISNVAFYIIKNTMGNTYTGNRPFLSRIFRSEWKIAIFLLVLCHFYQTLAGQEIDSTGIIDKRILKGRGFSNLTFSLDQRKAENENQLFRQVDNQQRLNYRVTANGGYALADNMTLGLGVSYGREREDITYSDQDGQQVTSNFLEYDISLIPNLRTYVPIGSGTFQIFIQTNFRISMGESLNRLYYAEESDKIEGKLFEAALGIQPGVLLFFDQNWAFETSVGLIGLTTRTTREITNNDRDNQAKIIESGIDLKINILTLNLGVARYF
jgi:hypothetical protein